MFTVEQRARLRADLLEYAASDGRISGAAITGSAAAGREDRWSDIDLAFGVAEAAELPNVVNHWTAHMYDRHSALHHLDVKAGAWLYRVFLLPGTLQVDLAFVPAAEFRALAPSFRLVYGKTNEPLHALPPSPADTIGFGWLYALHARTCIARNQLWQAEYMISAVRDSALTLACIRHGLPAVHGKGLDQLPLAVTAPFERALVRHLNKTELSRAFAVTIDGLFREIQCIDEELAGRLQRTLKQLCAPSPPAAAGI
jgi:hypothetical protein